MEFIDHTGHIFSLPSYEDNPISLQYTENDYIFWLKDNQVSINNYYILPIRFLLDYDGYNTKISELKITINSRFYKLIGPKYIQDKIERNKNINESIEFNLDDFKSELNLDDFYYDKDSNTNEENSENIKVFDESNHAFLLFPFYVIGRSEVEGTYLSNINIEITNINNKSFTPITVGCTFIDECEELIINGRNMGIKLWL